MLRRSLALLLVSAVLAPACAAPTLRSTTRYEDNFARPGPARWCVLAGARHGRTTKWDLRGNVLFDGLYRNGRRDGVWVFWRKPPWWSFRDRDRFDRIEVAFDEGRVVDADPVEEGP